MSGALDRSPPRGVTGPVRAFLQESEALVLEAEDRALRSAFLDGTADLAAATETERDALIDRLLKVAVDSLARAEAEARFAVEEAAAARTIIQRNNASLRESQNETRALIEQLVNG